jgi:hypothetical protein
MMWATALVAVCVALARGALATWGPEDVAIGPGAWGELAIVCGVVALGSGLVAIPSAATILSAEHPLRWVVPIMAYAGILTLFVLTVVTAIIGGFVLSASGGFFLFSLTTFGGVSAGLVIIRHCGYTLTRR